MGGLLSELVASVTGDGHAATILATLEIDDALHGDKDEHVSRAVFSMALNALLFQGLLKRVPTGASYVRDVLQGGRRVNLDHGALRTIRFGAGPTGAVPPGHLAFSRIFEPLGYEMAGLYPLDRLKMTGRAYAHRDFPESIPQFFLSELHVDRLSYNAQTTAQRVFGATQDPLRSSSHVALAWFAAERLCPLATARPALAEIAAAFDRWHAMPSLDDYHHLRAESAEAAWISTEGWAFNHATDRVPDVEALAERQRALGRPIKDAIEISASGTVRQTAFKADPVTHQFADANGEAAGLHVPGSFYEFITRDHVVQPSGMRRLDLRFDSGNATGIFKMTAAM